MRPPRYLSIEVAATPTGVGVRLAGELDYGSRDLLVGALRYVLAESPPLVEVNLVGLCLLDASGISVLIRMQRLAHIRGCHLFVSNPQGIVRRALVLTGVMPVLTPDQGSSSKLTSHCKPVNGARAHGGDLDVRSNRYETEVGGVPRGHLCYRHRTCRAAEIGRPRRHGYG